MPITSVLAHRVEEYHSSKTDKKTGKNISAVYEHHKLTGHNFDYDGAKILDRADSHPKLKVKEILHIVKIKPTINTQFNSQNLTKRNLSFNDKFSYLLPS